MNFAYELLEFGSLKGLTHLSGPKVGMQPLSEEDARSLEPGDHVKLIPRNVLPDGRQFGEVFWFRVVGPGEAVLDTSPVLIRGLDKGDRVVFEAKHVFGVSRVHG